MGKVQRKVHMFHTDIINRFSSFEKYLAQSRKILLPPKHKYN